jgi:single-stranded DNA-specific DHH superfamily exonuclease
MTLGIECLLADDPARAAELAGTLDAINRERRTVEAGMREQAERLVDRALAAAGEVDAAFAVYDPDFHEGVVGIIASRLKDRLHRPTFVFALGQDGALKGSGRSVEGLHLRDALDLVSKHHPQLLSASAAMRWRPAARSRPSRSSCSAAPCRRRRRTSAPRRRRSASPATGRSRRATGRWQPPA